MTITIETTDLERGWRSVGSLSLGKLTGESFALTNSGQTRSTPLLVFRGAEARVIVLSP
jgi:hypothetical protein